MKKAAGKKNLARGNIALALIGLVRFFVLVRFRFYQLASHMCSLNFNAACYSNNINVGHDIKCKSIKMCLYCLYIVMYANIYVELLVGRSY